MAPMGHDYSGRLVCIQSRCHSSPPKRLRRHRARIFNIHCYFQVTNNGQKGPAPCPNPFLGRSLKIESKLGGADDHFLSSLADFVVELSDFQTSKFKSSGLLERKENFARNQESLTAYNPREGRTSMAS
jgi:hypothetical protein